LVSVDLVVLSYKEDLCFRSESLFVDKFNFLDQQCFSLSLSLLSVMPLPTWIGLKGFDRVMPLPTRVWLKGLERVMFMASSVFVPSLRYVAHSLAFAQGVEHHDISYPFRVINTNFMFGVWYFYFQHCLFRLNLLLETSPLLDLLLFVNPSLFDGMMCLQQK
jgi:hypothetical protein